jgi:hypothetical protein
MIMRPSYRNKIMNKVFTATGFDISTQTAVLGFLDVAHAIDLMVKTMAYEEPQSPSDSARVVAKPEIKRMSWDEWVAEGFAVTQGHRESYSAIDVLMEEPTSRRGYQPSSISARSKAGEAAETSTRQNSNDREEGPLPIRIRVNSFPARRILNSLCDVDYFHFRSSPPIIMRPFKVLAIHSNEINTKLADIERIYTERVDKPATSRKAADGPLKDAKDHAKDGTSHENEAHCQGNDTVNIEDAVESDMTKADDRPPTQEPFLHGMDSFEGHNWDVLTLSEVKEALDDFRCLAQFVNETLQPVRTYLQDEPTLVNFNDIWHLFTTGSLVYVKDKSTPQKIWRVVQATGGRRYMKEPDPEIREWDTKYSPFVLDCYYLDFDGTDFVRVYRQFTIEMFEDFMPTAALQIMPLAVAERLLSGFNRADFRRQGEQFLTYLTPQYRYYQGTTLTRSPQGDPLFRETEDGRSHRLFTEKVESQVVIDFERGIQANPEWGPHEREHDLGKADPAEYDDVDEVTEKDSVWDVRVSDEFLRKEEIKRQRWNKSDALPEGDDLLLLPGRMVGYVLRTRSWGRFSSSRSRQADVC